MFVPIGRRSCIGVHVWLVTVGILRRAKRRAIQHHVYLVPPFVWCVISRRHFQREKVCRICSITSLVSVKASPSIPGKCTPPFLRKRSKLVSTC